MNTVASSFTAKVIAICMVVAFACSLAVIARTPSLSAQGIESNICEGAEISLAKGNQNSCQRNNACLTKDRDGNCTQTDAGSRLDSLIVRIINILSIVVGLVAVVVIIIGGAKYVTSGGDSGKIGSAKNTVVYAIVGLIIAALAQVIARFVLSKV